MRRTVITGIGAVSVLGLTREAIATSLYQGRSGIVSDQSRTAIGFRSTLTGRIDGFACPALSRKQKKSMPLFVQQAWDALRQAIEDASLPEETLRSERCGLVFGNDSSVGAAFDLAKLAGAGTPTSDLGSGHMFRIMNSTVSMNLGVLYGVRGCSWTASGACASGLLAVGQAFDCIRLGRQDVMLCGGAQELAPEAVCAFDGLGAFSVNSIPERASRPFDAARDGLVPSGGAAALVLEEREHAINRGARILGELLGWGYSSDGASLISPSPEGLGRAMRMALEDARAAPDTITEINAHATSTVLGDAMEAQNLRSLFGEAMPRVLTLKSLAGHEFWMAGASQLVYSAIMARKGFLAGSPNFERGEDATAGIPVLSHTLDEPPRRMLCNAAGFGGCNASMVVDFS
ncbi:MAG: beta-ketoacyl-[acyl-carrier-protein] synthase family protein [Desulfovibrio sp.]|nr:beta-ketoacyl-[acyl-carrier-protein] synthase family protein [Desulfovibrio sp.]